MPNIGDCQQSHGGGSEKHSIVWADSGENKIPASFEIPLIDNPVSFFYSASEFDSYQSLWKSDEKNECLLRTVLNI